MSLITPIVDIILFILNLYRNIIIISWLLELLIAFNILNTHNHIVYTVSTILNRLTEPVIRQIRRFVPTIAGFDFSFVILLMVIWLIERYLLLLFFSYR